jgi:hypothetical protein
VLLGFIELFNKWGLLFEDKEMAATIRDNLERTFSSYELS